MIRLLLILAMLAGGIPRFVAGPSGVRSGMSDTACHAPVVPMSCCEPSDAEACPMSGGPCDCAVAPPAMPDRSPDAPMPRTDREIVTGLPGVAPCVITLVYPEPPCARRPHLAGGPAVARTHNETRALLGIWRT